MQVDDTMGGAMPQPQPFPEPIVASDVANIQGMNALCPVVE